MPRRPRMYIPGFAYHVVQRGNNREACFYSENDYSLFLKLLREVLSRYEVKLHAFCLMTNHIHLLLTPCTTTGISNAIKVVCSRYAYSINKSYGRSGTVWGGRHKASPIDSERYLLQCHRYIELNPVTAKMVSSPEEYKWSSYHANAWGDDSRLISPHVEYLKLAQNKADRCVNYRELFREVLPEETIQDFRKAAHYCMPVGSDQFVKQIEAKIGRELGEMKGGPPPTVIG